MEVEYHDQLRGPVRVRATRVMVYDDFGNPVGVFLQHTPHHITAEIADDPVRFNALLHKLGIDKTLVVTVVKGPEGPLFKTG